MHAGKWMARTGAGLCLALFCGAAAAQGAGDDGIAETRPLDQPRADWEVQPRDEAAGQASGADAGGTEKPEADDSFGIDQGQTSRSLNRPTPPALDPAD